MRALIAGAAVLAALVVPGTAFAWSGAQITSVSCPEIHAKLPVENGPWKVLAVDEQGHTLVNVNVPGNASEQIIGGLWLLDNATHQVRVTVGNAANISDGKVTRTTQMTNCAAPVGRPGPPGAPGAPGLGYDCAGAVVPAGQTPASCPGTPGRDGPPGPPAKTCKSNRVYHVKVGARFRGEPIHAARLTWDNQQRHATAVRRSDGRLHAVVSFKGVTSPLRGLWAIQMRITFDGGKHANLTRMVRLCAPSDGELNFATDVHRDGT
jgi:hypothetical protein